MNDRKKTEMIFLILLLLNLILLLSVRLSDRAHRTVTETEEIAEDDFLLFYQMRGCAYCAKAEKFLEDSRQPLPVYYVADDSSLWQNVPFYPVLVLYREGKAVRWAEGPDEIQTMLIELTISK